MLKIIFSVFWKKFEEKNPQSCKSWNKLKAQTAVKTHRWLSIGCDLCYLMFSIFITKMRDIFLGFGQTELILPVTSPCYRAAGRMSGHRVPPPTPYHHSTGEGLWTCSQRGQVSQTDAAKVQNFEPVETIYLIVNIYPLFHFLLLLSCC